MAVLFNFTGSLTGGNPTITALSSMAGLRVGMPITGAAGIPSGTTIQSLDPGASSLTMSADSSVTASSEALQATLPGATQLVANNIQNAFGELLASGALVVEPTDGGDRPITATSGALGGGPITLFGAATPITNGSIGNSVFVPDVSETEPAYISYRITILDELGIPQYVLCGVQPTGGSLDLDTYVPNVAGQAIIQQGPQGPPGSIGGGLETVACSPTAVYDASRGAIFKTVLSEDVTAPEFINGDIGASVIVFRIIQDSAGGHAWTWPANMRGGGLINSTPNSTTIQAFSPDADGSADALSPPTSY